MAGSQQLNFVSLGMHLALFAPFVAVTQSTDLRIGVHIIRKHTPSFAPMLSARILIL